MTLPRPALLLAALACGCSTAVPAAPEDAAPAAHDGGDGIGADVAGQAACLGCHWSIGFRWRERPSSHSLTLDCFACHTPSGPPGPGHVATGGCDRCHSARPHPAGAACTTCHEPHGTSNAFLVRTRLERPDGTEADLHVTAAEGASADGLAHAGVPGAAPGVCETCHTATRFYRRSGDGEPHSTAFCVDCHAHDAGFAPPYSVDEQP
ncbi:MAG TPA: cytochrome c3 family protein [Polyangia bacterium]|jgi:hypothetical protein